MRNVHTLKDISSGHRLGSAREMELEEMLRDSIQSIFELTNEYNDMQGVYLSYSKRNDRDKAKLHRNLKQTETNNRKLSDRIHQLIDEMSQLRSEMDSLNFQITRKDISLAEFKDKLATKSKETKTLRLELEQVRGDLSSTKYELESLEKGVEEKDNIYKWAIISKKDNEVVDLSNPPPPPMNDSSQKLPGWVSDDLRFLVYERGLEDKVMELDKSFARENILEALQELLPWDEMVLRSQTDILPNQSIYSRPAHSEKFISREGGAEAEAVPLSQEMPLASVTVPVVTSSLISPMVMYSILALLLIAVIWFVVRKCWNSWKKSNTEYSPNRDYFLSSPGISEIRLYDRSPEDRK
ncbi:unnamed protein product [Rhizophagus irregularis]|nr:unnamed protein product [Rhizophagus irregularis]